MTFSRTTSIRLDNLYMSANFLLGSFKHPKKVMMEGFSRTSSRVVPTKILQQQVTKKERINSVKVTIKSCALEGVPALDICTIVACSIYNTKPVHFFLMCCNNITWWKKNRRTWYKSTSTIRLGRLLRLAIHYLYNMDMNNVNIGDQLMVSKRPYRWMRKQKWWWSMFFGGHGTLLVNAYVA